MVPYPPDLSGVVSRIRRHFLTVLALSSSTKKDEKNLRDMPFIRYQRALGANPGQNSHGVNLLRINICGNHISFNRLGGIRIES